MNISRRLAERRLDPDQILTKLLDNGNRKKSRWTHHAANNTQCRPNKPKPQTRIRPIERHRHKLLINKTTAKLLKTLKTTTRRRRRKAVVNLKKNTTMKIKTYCKFFLLNIILYLLSIYLRSGVFYFCLSNVISSHFMIICNMKYLN